MRKVKILCIVFLLLVFMSAAIASDPNFSFSPSSGTKMKLYCPNPVYMIIDWWSDTFNWFQSSISFDSNNIIVVTWVIHADFESASNAINWSLYNVWWVMNGWFNTWILTWVSFDIITKSNILSTSLYFVDENWNDPVFWPNTTKDGISLNGYDKWLADILSGVIPVTYEFVALPCEADWNAPTITNISAWTTKVPTDAISFLTYDWGGGLVSYWFSGNSVWNISNYVSATGKHVDNQEWVDSSSISVRVSCPTCSNPKLNMEAPLSISDWNWDNTKNALTWDSERRWYNVSFGAPFTYEVEKKVTVEISVSDNPNENGKVHTGTKTFSFNAPVAPEILPISPSTSDFVSPSREFITFKVSDDWAGVDTWKVVISTIYSGKEFIYSGSDLTFVLTWWDVGLWNAWSYIVSFMPKEDFPVSTKITVNVTWVDLAWTTGTYQREFTTRPSCDFFWCIDSLDIVMGGISYLFTWKFLSVTWTNPNSTYPYFTWENNEILMCGKDWTWINFVGIPIYDVTWNLLWWSTYTNHQLIITWLNFVFNSWVILIQ